jgi:CheY-like chemotaxis protein
MTSMSMKPPRALIVDDHSLVRELMGRMVEHFGYEVAGFAEDGRDAVEKARTCDPDFILMDLHMPGMDGIAATEQIIGERQLPILICTGLISSALATKAREAGACAVLMKPYPAEKLRDQLTTLFPDFSGTLGAC